MVKLAVLDDYPAISKAYFDTLPSSYAAKLDITVFTEAIPPSELAVTLAPFEIISTMRERTRFPADLVEKLSNLKYLTTTGMKNAGLDLPAFKDKGIIVTGASGPAIPAPAVTVQHTWALILDLASNVTRDHNATRNGHWLDATPLNTTLGGKTFSALGLGRLGAAAAKIAKLGFNMRVIAWSENLTQEKADQLAVRDGLPKGTYEVVSKERLFAEADVLSVHLVLSARSTGIVGHEELSAMKSSALLVNTSRGPIIDEPALLNALEKGKIRGIGLDVFDIEPLPLDSPWRTTKWGQEGRSEVVLTPHSGYTYEETLDGWWKETVDNVRRYIDGQEVSNRII
ncbi:D-isomer specific 2-hydroxyacid dehydrogenase [Naematelia encephala]|uniref:D-isomer specific 2-hydroxyacid dehydrogenase n=1 Tax=Naematelia encephala TaxID=71784 RepID=A0A1Y2ALB3_9TREE|nr:D-isomer specific 2-hydroxyacid dehydrogenase [Naematelia encephala]